MTNAPRHHGSSAHSPRPRPRGFTLVEVLVVVGIIAVLLGLVAGVGPLVFSNQRKAQTSQLLNTLDRALDEYSHAAGGIPKFVAEQYANTPGVDNELTTYGSELFPARPDSAVFLAQIKGVGECDAIISGIPSQFLIATPTDDGSRPDPSDPSSISLGGGVDAPSVVDSWADAAWGPPWNIAEQRVIYYVHPSNLLAQDLYGKCVNRRPYFMSAGPDEKYGLTSEIPAPASGEPLTHAQKAELLVADNIYSYTPGPIKKDMTER